MIDYTLFKDKLDDVESNNNYNADNGIAFGRYQFIASTIDFVASQLLRIPVPSISDFKNNPALQDEFFYAYAKYLDKRLSLNGSKNHLGEVVTGKTNNITAKINEYGLLAGAWLGGDGGVYDLLMRNIDHDDGNKFISDYVAYFSSIFSNDEKKKLPDSDACNNLYAISNKIAIEQSLNVINAEVEKIKKWLK